MTTVFVEAGAEMLKIGVMCLNNTVNNMCLIDRDVQHVKHRVSLVFDMLAVLVLRTSPFSAAPFHTCQAMLNHCNAGVLDCFKCVGGFVSSQLSKGFQICSNLFSLQ